MARCTVKFDVVFKAIPSKKELANVPANILPNHKSASRMLVDIIAYIQNEAVQYHEFISSFDPSFKLPSAHCNSVFIDWSNFNVGRLCLLVVYFQ